MGCYAITTVSAAEASLHLANFRSSLKTTRCPLLQEAQRSLGVCYVPPSFGSPHTLCTNLTTTALSVVHYNPCLCVRLPNSDCPESRHQDPFIFVRPAFKPLAGLQ